MPDGAVLVGRPSVWGSPFRVTRSGDFHGLPGSWFVLDRSGAAYYPEADTQRSARQRAVDLYAEQLAAGDGRVSVLRVRAELVGRDLVCWCPRQEPCHADVLLAIAAGIADPSDLADPADLADLAAETVRIPWDSRTGHVRASRWVTPPAAVHFKRPPTTP